MTSPQAGEPLLDVSPDNPALKAVKALLAKAGVIGEPTAADGPPK